MNDLNFYQAPSAMNYEENDYWTFAPCGAD